MARAIEEALDDNPQRDGAINREILLAEMAFNPTRKLAATTKKLIDRALQIIERGDWISARRAILKIALVSGSSDADSSPIDERLAKWAPRRERYFSSVYDILGTWKRAPDVEEVLFRGMYDEERSGQHSAAMALAKMCGGDADLGQKLLGLIRSTLDASVAAAALESLSQGWATEPLLPKLLDEALVSSDATMRLVGVVGRISGGRATDTDRDALLGFLHKRSELEFLDQERARTLLATHWSNEKTIIDMALSSVSCRRSKNSDFEREAATLYLLRCDPNNASVAGWVRAELEENYPFSILRDEALGLVVPFAKAHPDIRQSAISLVISRAQRLILGLLGDEIRDNLILLSRSGDNMDRYWAVSSLLQGWVRSDAKVAALFNEIPTWSDELLNNLSSLLPDIYQDKRACRSRLLGIANGVECARLDFITQGLTKLGSDASDQEAVDTLINKLGKGSPLYEPGAAFILGYSKNPDVRQHAIRTLKTHEPMLAVLARAYETDDEIRKKLLGLLNPLPTALRYDLLEAAIAEMDSRQAFRSLLADYDHEVNSDLKIASSIHYHRSLARGKPDESHLATLKDRLNVLGSNFQERRAAAFAGILLLGHLGDFVPLWECGDKPMHVRIGSGYGNESDSLAELICEKWIELKTAFGETLASRFGDFGSNGYEFWKYLSPHIHSSTAARRDFLAYCHSTQDLLALNSLRTFAEEQPSSERLLELCWKGFDREILKTQKKQDSPWATQKMRLEIAYILKHHFGNRADVIDRVAKMLKGGGAPEAVALLLLDPQNAAWSDLKFTSAEIAEKFHDWVAAVNLSAAQDPAHTFLDLTCGMLNREEHGIWNFQEIINHAVIERLQRDENVAKLFKERLGSNPTLNELASIPQYLMAAGAMDSETLELAKTLLRDEGKYDLPRTAYDGLSDEIRCVARSLMEVISPSVSLH